MRSISCLLILAIVLLNSCSKPGNPELHPNQKMPFPVDNQPDSFSGKQFVFDSLVWGVDDFGRVAFEIENSTLFSNPYRSMSIILMQDSSSFWESVVHVAGNSSYKGYLYGIASRTLFIWRSPDNPLLIGKYFSIQVTFL